MRTPAGAFLARKAQGIVGEDPGRGRVRTAWARSDRSPCEHQRRALGPNDGHPPCFARNALESGDPAPLWMLVRCPNRLPHSPSRDRPSSGWIARPMPHPRPEVGPCQPAIREHPKRSYASGSLRTPKSTHTPRRVRSPDASAGSAPDTLRPPGLPRHSRTATRCPSPEATAPAPDEPGCRCRSSLRPSTTRPSRRSVGQLAMPVP
jgi:hypothetical protein